MQPQHVVMLITDELSNVGNNAVYHFFKLVEETLVDICGNYHPLMGLTDKSEIVFDGIHD